MPKPTSVAQTKKPYRNRAVRARLFRISWSSGRRPALFDLLYVEASLLIILLRHRSDDEADRANDDCKDFPLSIDHREYIRHLI